MNSPSTFIQPIANTIIEGLFDKEAIRIAESKQQVIRKNIALGGSRDGFTYNGMIFSTLDPKLVRQGVYSPLDLSLFAEIEAAMKDEQTVEFDKVRVRQALVLVLKNCRTIQDIRDALPNAVMDFLGHIGRLKRTRPEAFNIEENTRAYKQYMELKEKIDFYTASRLIF